ncbi:MAG: hypothetical protein R2762_24520 [Bryobacteraceae bacterium]
MNLKPFWICALLTAPLFAGPPLICHRIEIGDAASLPWTGAGDHWDGSVPGYNVESRLMADTLELLGAATPVPVRMETMRRASIYAARHAGLAAKIAARLRARADASGSALDWFDAGYWIESVRQASFLYRYGMLSPQDKESWQIRTGLAGLDGYPLVQKAMQLGGAPEMDRALKLIEQYREADRRSHR